MNRLEKIDKGDATVYKYTLQNGNITIQEFDCNAFSYVCRPEETNYETKEENGMDRKYFPARKFDKLIISNSNNELRCFFYTLNHNEVQNLKTIRSAVEKRMKKAEDLITKEKELKKGLQSFIQED